MSNGPPPSRVRPPMCQRDDPWCADWCQECRARAFRTDDGDPAQSVRTPCHYCGEPATTVDHIVPRSLLFVPEPQSPLVVYLGYTAPPPRKRIPTQHNTVPACRSCNHRKGVCRSLCDCRRCRAAWENYGPPGWCEAVPIADVGRAQRAV